MKKYIIGLLMALSFGHSYAAENDCLADGERLTLPDSPRVTLNNIEIYA